MYRRQLIFKQIDASVWYKFSHLFLLVFSASLESEESKTSGCALSMRKNRADRNRDTRMRLRIYLETDRQTGTHMHSFI